MKMYMIADHALQPMLASSDGTLSWDSLPVIHSDGSLVMAYEIRPGMSFTFEFDPRRNAYLLIRDVKLAAG
jgi:hypothetical protein